MSWGLVGAAAINVGASYLSSEDGGPQQPSAPDVGAQAKQRVGIYRDELGNVIDTEMAAQPRYGQLAKGAYDQTAAIDPQRTAIKGRYADMVQSDLALGGQLSPEQIRMTQQATRGAQQARGGALYGNAPVAQEAFRTYLASDALRNQRMGQANQYLQQYKPQNEIYAPMMPDPSRTTHNLITDAGQAANQQYGQQMSAYNQQASNYVSPWAAAGSTAMDLYGAYQSGGGAGNINPNTGGVNNSWGMPATYGPSMR